MNPDPNKKVRIVGIGECERCSFVTIPPRDKRHPDHKDTALLCRECAMEDTSGPTHHNACDCREAKFKRLLEAAKAMMDSVVPHPEHHPTIFRAKLELEKSVKELEL